MLLILPFYPHFRAKTNFEIAALFPSPYRLWKSAANSKLELFLTEWSRSNIAFALMQNGIKIEFVLFLWIHNLQIQIVFQKCAIFQMPVFRKFSFCGIQLAHNQFSESYKVIWGFEILHTIESFNLVVLLKVIVLRIIAHVRADWT